VHPQASANRAAASPIGADDSNGPCLFTRTALLRSAVALRISVDGTELGSWRSLDSHMAGRSRQREGWRRQPDRGHAASEAYAFRHLGIPRRLQSCNRQPNGPVCCRCWPGGRRRLPKWTRGRRWNRPPRQGRPAADEEHPHTMERASSQVFRRLRPNHSFPR